MIRGLRAWPGASLAIASAVLFGASTPFAKLLLGDGVNPWLLAGLLYLGSGVGLGVVHVSRRFLGLAQTEAPLRRADLPWLFLVVLSGGAVGPVLLMIGLSTTPASMSIGPGIPPASPTATGTATRRWSTSTRSIRTCITVTGMPVASAVG